MATLIDLLLQELCIAQRINDFLPWPAIMDAPAIAGLGVMDQLKVIRNAASLPCAGTSMTILRLSSWPDCLIKAGRPQRTSNFKIPLQFHA